MKLPALILALLLAGCASMAGGRDSLDTIAADYVRLQLEIGEKEDGYIDAYYGPPEWQAAAKLTASVYVTGRAPSRSSHRQAAVCSGAAG